MDLFCTEIIGFKGFMRIRKEVENHFEDQAISFIDLTNINDQFTFLRFFIKSNSVIIKVDLIQNMKSIDPIEEIEGVRVYSLRDFGLFKMLSASSRTAKKDIYDLYYITEQIPIIELYQTLLEKYSRFNGEKDRSIFDLDKEENAIHNPLLLLRFDNNYKVSKDKMMHSHDNIIIMENSVSWRMASIHWRMQIRRLCLHLNIEYPSPRKN
ncbi:nucleotidyl transferase AbiEii/AbiGii toxin family protein [Belliella sp. DSM 111904]|uniref:Nucleotidyl transferase AbiEii/AbiGii toxin family protein n=1 Tax=Belliella filtrata TaxID=2923435 RepID=A0ABS9V2C0_9BACT|nr:nucleotidyl transferase AbiEii/AbiGii toxin family protein [Belliella filtrata]